MSYYSIANEILDILETVRDAPGSRLASVYDTEVPTSITYPYAVVSTGEATEEILDTSTNKTLYRF